LGAPAATSAWLFGIGHSAHCGSTHSGLWWRWQTKVAGQAAVVIDVHPLAPKRHVLIEVPAHSAAPS
jgi:hypothetical protein